MVLKRWTLRILCMALALAAAAVAFLVWDTQWHRYRAHRGSIESEIADAREMLDRAAALAPDGNAAHGALADQIADARARIREMRDAFLEDASADERVRDALQAAGADADSLLSLAGIARHDREFYRMHDYRIEFSSQEIGLRTAAGLGEGPLFHTWRIEPAVVPDELSGRVETRLRFFSLLGDDLPPYTRMSTCSPRSFDGLWLPPLPGRLQVLEPKRAALCAEGTEHPARTLAMLEIVRLRSEFLMVRTIHSGIEESLRNVEPDTVASESEVREE